MPLTTPEEGPGDLLPVVVVHYKAPEWCRSTVSAIEASLGVRTAIYVVNNGGEIAGDLPSSIEVLEPLENLGYSSGANLGLRTALAQHSAARYVAVCSHDARPEPRTLQTVIETMDSSPEIGIAAPSLSGAQPSCGGMWTRGRAVYHRPSPHDDALIDRDWLSGSLLVIRTECLRQIGGFDERFGSYVEDVDLCLRASDAGWRVVCATTCSVSTEGSRSDQRSRLAATNAILLTAKRRGVVAARVATIRYLLRALRALTLSVVARQRTQERRLGSRRWGLANLAAVRESITTDRVRQFARCPMDGVVPVVYQATTPRHQHTGSTPSTE